jgi:hypothetical protein
MTAALVEERETGVEGEATVVVEEAASSPRAGEARTPARNVAMTSLFTPRQYTKSKNMKHLYRLI